MPSDEELLVADEERRRSRGVIKENAPKSRTERIREGGERAGRFVREKVTPAAMKVVGNIRANLAEQEAPRRGERRRGPIQPSGFGGFGEFSMPSVSPPPMNWHPQGPPSSILGSLPRKRSAPKKKTGKKKGKRRGGGGGGGNPWDWNYRPPALF